MKQAKRTQPDKESARVEAAKRTGPEFRKDGENITSERLLETFGLRGVNFGNWLKGSSPKLLRERQLHLNHAYDALMDLAELTGLPPKALSLNGMLGLAIGAQGSGGVNAAHFVPGVNEINITRAHGAGSLAHEWAHALDHYFAVQAGETIARDKYPFLTQWSADEKNTAGVRPEIRQAFNKIVNNMQSRKLTEEEQARSDGNKRSELERRIQNVLQALHAYTRDMSESAEADWKALSDRLLSGDIGEGKVDTGILVNIRGQSVKGAKLPLEVPAAVVEVLKLVREHGGNSISSQTENIKDLGMYSRWLSATIKEQAQRSQHVPQSGKPVGDATTASDYLLEANKLDGSTGKKQGGQGYWSSKLEMFARAFQSYVLDRLADKAQRSDYLTYQQRSAEEHAALNDMLRDAGHQFPSTRLNPFRSSLGVRRRGGPASEAHQRLQLARQPATELQRAVQRCHADAGHARRGHRLVLHVAVQVGHVAGTEVAQFVVVGAFQDLGQLAAAVAVDGHALAGRDLQQHERVAAAARGADHVHAGRHPAPAQRLPGLAEIGLERTRERVDGRTGGGGLGFRLRRRHRLAQARQHVVAQATGEDRLGGHGLLLEQQRAADVLGIGQLAAAVRTDFQMGVGHGRHFRRQRACRMADQGGGVQMVARRHTASCTPDCRRRKARRMEDLTVPSGMPSSSAICWWDLASK